MKKNEEKVFISAGNRILVGITVGTIVGYISACIGVAIHKNNVEKKETEPEPTTTTIEQTELSDVIVGDVGPDDIKIFDKGQHYISVRIHANEYVAAGNIEGYAINNIPEGYEIYEITPYNVWHDRGTKTNGYDIWFVNTEPVEVHASYNDDYEQYGYFTFGEVVENEKTLTK